MTTHEQAPGQHATAAWLRTWVAACVDGLALARQEIDDLNVFPVPDGDTGTNLYLTMASAWSALAEAVESGALSLAEATSALRRGALVGARGNSGVILAQMMNGAAEEIAALGEGAAWTSSGLARVLRRASDEGYRAVGQPVEGTILSVARAAADAAEALEAATIADSGRIAHVAADIAHVAADIVQAAKAALARTPEQLESLRLAGVVDAGGQGLVVVLEGLTASLAGIAPGAPTVEVDWVSGSAPARPPIPYVGPQYEVMFMLESTPPQVEELRGALTALGDSLVVVGSEGTWNVHVHVDDAGAAIERAMAAGRPTNIRVTYLPAQRSPEGEPVTVARGLVAVSHGVGTAALLRQAGTHVVEVGGGQRPSTGDFLAAIDHLPATEIIILPSDSDARASAESAASQARRPGIRVAVVPTRSIVQTLAAVAVHDPQRDFDQDVAAMSAAAGATHYAAVTIASKAALTSAGECRPGDVLGIVDGDIVEVGTELDDVSRSLLDRMLASGGDLVTVILGQDADTWMRHELAPWLRRAHPLADVVVHDGGQPLWPVILGVE